MPLYIPCERCQLVSVAKLGDICERCEEQARQAEQARIDHIQDRDEARGKQDERSEEPN